MNSLDLKMEFTIFTEFRMMSDFKNVRISKVLFYDDVNVKEMFICTDLSRCRNFQGGDFFFFLENFLNSAHHGWVGKKILISRSSKTPIFALCRLLRQFQNRKMCTPFFFPFLVSNWVTMSHKIICNIIDTWYIFCAYFTVKTNFS